MTLAQRREELITISGLQREALAFQLQSLMHPLSHVDTGISFMNRMRQKPLLMAGLAVGVLAITPRRLKNLFRNGMAAWQTWRTLAPAVQSMLSYRTK